MKVSTKGRYGLRVLLDIALHQHEGPVALRDMAARQEISQKYLWQIVNPLKAAGLVNTVRGAQGGCLLAREPQQITMLDVVSILEGPVVLVDCMKDPGCCGRSSRCAAQRAWDEVTGVMQTSMKSITLSDLMRWESEYEQPADNSYVI